MQLSPYKNRFERGVSMSILVVGSIGLDTVETPFGKAEDVLGGSAAYFSAAASFFTEVSLVTVVGEDFNDKELEFLKARNVDLSGLQRVKGKTFRWSGRYDYDLHDAHTLETHLNVLEDFSPTIPEEYRDEKFVFLANIDPELQLEVLDQIRNPEIVAMDTMNYWIRNKPEELRKVLERVDIVLINEMEARELSGEPILVKAARKIMELGPKYVVIRRGEYGALMFVLDEGIFSAPSYPLEEVFDPTGDGDAFAGGFMGCLAKKHGDLTTGLMKKAVIYGSVMASFNAQQFSIDSLKELTSREIEARYKAFQKMTHF